MTDSVHRIDVAVVGVTGLVGEALLAELEQREFPVGKLSLLAGDSADDEASRSFANRSYPIGVASEFDFSRCQLAFFCTPAEVSCELVPRALAAGCRVIDVSAAFRLQADVPLQVAGLPLQESAGLVALPDASVVQAATLLAPLAERADIRRVVMTTLLAVSSRGRRAVNELAGQTARLLNAQSFDTAVFPVQIAFNSVPLFDATSFDAPQDCGYTHTELQLAVELRKVLRRAELEIAVTQLVAPVFYGQTQILQVEFATPLTSAVLRDAIAAAPGVEWLEQGEVMAPVGGGMSSDTVVVGRIRQDSEDGRHWTLWSVADNIRKGAAVNSVQVAENLLKSYA